MDYRTDFKETLIKKGLVAEKEFIELYLDYLNKKNNLNSFNHYTVQRIEDSRGDVLIKDSINKPEELTFEVKNDIKGSDTGNIYIEFESWDKPSGILTTKSDYWAINFEYEKSLNHINYYYVINRDRLLRMCNIMGFKNGVAGGDLNSSYGLLFPYLEFEESVLEGEKNNDGSFILDKNLLSLGFNLK